MNGLYPPVGRHPLPRIGQVPCRKNTKKNSHKALKASILTQDNPSEGYNPVNKKRNDR